MSCLKEELRMDGTRGRTKEATLPSTEVRRQRTITLSPAKIFIIHFRANPTQLPRSLEWFALLSASELRACLHSNRRHRSDVKSVAGCLGGREKTRARSVTWACIFFFARFLSKLESSTVGRSPDLAEPVKYISPSLALPAVEPGHPVPRTQRTQCCRPPWNPIRAQTKLALTLLSRSVDQANSI